MLYVEVFPRTLLRRIRAKPDGGTLEEKIVQRAVVEQILNPIYEPEFYGFNYGFRPERSAHDALDALAYAIERRKVNWIVEVDIRAFFDNIDREQLMRFLEMRIGDRRVLNVGVIDAGLEVDVVRGTLGSHGGLEGCLLRPRRLAGSIVTAVVPPRAADHVSLAREVEAGPFEQCVAAHEATERTLGRLHADIVGPAGTIRPRNRGYPVVRHRVVARTLYARPGGPNQTR